MALRQNAQIGVAYLENECKQWNVDEEYVEITHDGRRFLMLLVNLDENFAKKRADALKATAKKLNTRMFYTLYIRSAGTVEAAENCPQIVVRPLLPDNEVENLLGRAMDRRIGYASEWNRYEIYCGEDHLATIEPADEALTYGYVTVTWKFDE